MIDWTSETHKADVVKLLQKGLDARAARQTDISTSQVAIDFLADKLSPSAAYDQFIVIGYSHQDILMFAQKVLFGEV